MPIIRWPDTFVKWERANDNSIFGCPRKFRERLSRRGYVWLGSGYYSCVLGKEGSDRVIKICRDIDGGSWFNYILWANANGYAGTYAPVVYSWKVYNDKFGVAVMERLKGVEHEDDSYVLPMIVEASAKYDNKMAHKMLDFASPGMAKFVQDLKEAKLGRLDLHGGNFMARNDGTLVATDPISNSLEEKKIVDIPLRWKSTQTNKSSVRSL